MIDTWGILHFVQNDMRTGSSLSRCSGDHQSPARSVSHFETVLDRPGGRSLRTNTNRPRIWGRVSCPKERQRTAEPFLFTVHALLSTLQFPIVTLQSPIFNLNSPLSTLNSPITAPSWNCGREEYTVPIYAARIEMAESCRNRHNQC